MTTSDDTNPDLPAVTTPAPCPFCGEAADIGVRDVPRIGLTSYRRPGHTAHCRSCGAAGPACDTAAEAVREWNDRNGRVEPNPLATVARWVAWDGEGAVGDVVADRRAADAEAEYMRKDGRPTAKPYLAVVQIYEAVTPEAVEKFSRGLADLIQRRLACDPRDRMLANNDEPKGASEE